MTTNPLSRRLRYAALGIATLGVLVWLLGGARVGWTQTSVVDMHRDEITGIDYPVRRDAFVPGVEFPVVGAMTAIALVTASFIVRPRSR